MREIEKFKLLVYEEVHEEEKNIWREKADTFFAERPDKAYLIDHIRDIDGIIIKTNGRANRKVM